VSLTELFTKLIDLLVVPRLDPLALYPARVVSQGDDGTVDVKPDAAKLGAGLAMVPIRHGLPGVTVRVKAGARVLLGFEGGDITRPFAALWEAGGLESLTIEASGKVIVKAPVVCLGDEEGAQPLARVGDLVEVALPPLAPFSGTIGGAPATGAITFTDTALGFISSGSDVGKSK